MSDAEHKPAQRRRGRDKRESRTTQEIQVKEKTAGETKITPARHEVSGGRDSYKKRLAAYSGSKAKTSWESTASKASALLTFIDLDEGSLQ